MGVQILSTCINTSINSCSSSSSSPPPLTSLTFIATSILARRRGDREYDDEYEYTNQDQGNRDHSEYDYDYDYDERSGRRPISQSKVNHIYV